MGGKGGGVGCEAVGCIQRQLFVVIGALAAAASKRKGFR